MTRDTELLFADPAPDDAWYEDAIEEEDQDLGVTEYDITAAPNDFNVSTIFDFIDAGSIEIPGFQRNYVWDIKRASKLIESLIIGLPVPQIFLYERTKNKFLVIDGQQRLMSIYYFMKQRFPKKEKRPYLRRVFSEKGSIPKEILHNDEVFDNFNLVLPSKLPGRKNHLHGLNFSTLQENAGTLKLRTIRNIVIKQLSPQGDDAIFEIFNRLNTGGVNLQPQEIRTSLYHSNFYDALYRMNLDPRWRRLTGLAEPDLRMKDIEILLRGFAMLINGDDYRPSMVRFLNQFSKDSQRMNAEGVKYHEQLFAAFLDACNPLPDTAFFGQGTRKMNVTTYEALFAAACANARRTGTVQVEALDPAKVEELKTNDEFVKATKTSAADTVNVKARLRIAGEVLR